MNESDTQGQPAMIGSYPIERELGRGGMGVVYLARDPRLNRQVAVKVLPAAFVADPMRLQRFEREARTLAALNHRNVAMIFGLEDAGGQRLLVLEFVPGLTLTERMSRGGMPLDEVVNLCVQMAEGLEAAHERDVVHRDLKPDNVKVTPEGLIKILDFGLATSGSANAHSGGSQLTVAGMVMGTPGYMSPEQARGFPTDKRTDVWAFGCVLYEMLSGYRAFTGETVSDAIAAVLEREPDYTLLPARLPNRMRELIRKMLVKDPRKRLRDIGDARIELEDVMAQPQSGWYQAAGAATQRPGTVARLLMPLGSMNSAAAAAAQAASAAGTGVGTGTNNEIVLTNSSRGALAISPDGSSAVFVAGKPPQTMLYLRRMDAFEARPIPGTQGGDAPFFSHDGTKVGFFEGGKLKRVSLTGGAPVPLAPAPRGQGGCWDSSDMIYYVPDWQRGLMRVPAAGGTPELVVEPDLANGELALLAPEILPGGKKVLVSVWTGADGGYDEALITAVDLRTRQRTPLIHGGCNPKYLPSGHIVFSRGGSLLAVAFDHERMEVFGQPAAFEDKVLGHALGGSAHFAAGGDGTLIVAQGPIWEPRSTILAAGKTPEPVPLINESRSFVSPVISPTGFRMCVQVQGATDHLYMYDLDKPGHPGARLTHHADNACPVFSPDGSKLAFRSNMSGRYELYVMALDQAGGIGPEAVFGSDRSPTPCAMGRNEQGGNTLVFTQQRVGTPGAPGAPGSAGSALELWALDLDRPDSARPLVQGNGSSWGASVSPDGKLLAFVADDTGRPEVYVQPMSGGQRRQVSSDAGTAPVWARTGGELYYRAGEQIIAVRVAIEPAFMVGRPRMMFQGPALGATTLSRNFDALPDGQFVLLRLQEDQTRVTSLNVILNVFSELRKRMPLPQMPSAAGSRMSTPGFNFGSSSGLPSGAPAMLPPLRSTPSYTPNQPPATQPPWPPRPGGPGGSEMPTMS